MNSETWFGKPIKFLATRFAWLFVLLVSIVLAAIVIKTGPNAAPLEQAERSWPVSVVPARPTDLSPQYFAYGKVESRQVASLKTSISAPVKSVYRHEGEWVEQGDIIIELDASEAQLAHDIALANYEKNLAQLRSVETEQQLAISLVAQYQQLRDIAEARLQRAVELHQKSMISDSDLDLTRQEASEKVIQIQEHLARVEDFPNRIAQQQANVDESSAYLEKARIELDQARITAPFAGRIIRTDVSQGDRVIAGSSLVRIADYSGLEIRTSVPAGTASELRAIIARGDKVMATAELEGRKLSFPLVRLAADVKPGQSGVDAFFAVVVDDTLNIGRTLQLAITLPEKSQVIPMPIYALYQDQTLYKVVENRLQGVRYEEVGDFLDSDGVFNLLVRSEQISSGDLLVISQLPRAITGLLVEPIENGMKNPLGIN